MNIGLSVVGAQEIYYQERANSQLERGDLYIKVFFSIIHEDFDPNDTESLENKVAEGLVVRDIVGSSHQMIDISEKINETIIIDCSDLIVNDDGICDDAEGQYLKILEAIYELSIIIDRNRLRVPIANVHIAVYGFELIEDTVRGFSYLLDDDNSLCVIDEKLCSYIMELPPFFTDLNDYGWIMLTEYIGVFEYYQLCQPLEGCVETQSIRESVSTKLGPSVPTHNQEENDDNRIFYLSATENVFNNEYESNNWLDTTQLVFDVVGFVPGLSEITSLVNGFIYLGREWHAGITGDYDQMIEYRNRAIEGFVFAIPGSSILKGGIKFFRAGKAIKNVHRAEEVANTARRNSKKAKQALNKIKNKKTSKRKKAIAKDRNRNAQNQSKISNQSLDNAIKTRDLRLREGGWTINELTDTSKNALRRSYRNIMNTSDEILRRTNKIPSTNIDRTIDTVKTGVDVVRFGMDHPQTAY